VYINTGTGMKCLVAAALEGLNLNEICKGKPLNAVIFSTSLPDGYT